MIFMAVLTQIITCVLSFTAFIPICPLALRNIKLDAFVGILQKMITSLILMVIVKRVYTTGVFYEH